MRTAAAILGLVVSGALLGCASPQLSPGPGPIDRAQDSVFALEVRTPRDHYLAGEVIPVSTTIAYLGPRDQTVASSDYPSLVTFGLEQIDGPLDMPGGASRLMCETLRLTAREPVSVPFTKAGGFSDSDPTAPFWRAYFADKQLHLPAGMWRVTASLRARLTPDCTGPLHSVSAGVSFVVGD